jgi:hypothetical protein
VIAGWELKPPRSSLGLPRPAPQPISEADRSARSLDHFDQSCVAPPGGMHVLSESNPE